MIHEQRDHRREPPTAGRAWRRSPHPSSSATKPSAPAAEHEQRGRLDRCQVAPDHRATAARGRAAAPAAGQARSSVRPTARPKRPAQPWVRAAAATRPGRRAARRRRSAPRSHRDAGGAGEHADRRRVRRRTAARSSAAAGRTRSVAQSSSRCWLAKSRAASRPPRPSAQRAAPRVEELLGAVERLAHLGPAGLERLDAQTHQPRALVWPSVQSTNSRTAAWRARAAQQPSAGTRPGSPAGSGFRFRREVGLVEHHPRRGWQTGAAVGFDGDQARRAQADVASNSVSPSQARRVEHGGIDQASPRGGAATTASAAAPRRRPELQRAAQRIARRHGLGRDRARRAAARDRWPAPCSEGGARRGRQAERPRLGGDVGRRGLVARDDRVAAESWPASRIRPPFQPVGEEADRRQRRASRPERQRDGERPAEPTTARSPAGAAGSHATDELAPRGQAPPRRGRVGMEVAFGRVTRGRRLNILARVGLEEQSGARRRDRSATAAPRSTVGWADDPSRGRRRQSGRRWPPDREWVW